MEVEKQCRIIFSNYFYLVYERYGVAMPDKADWGLPQLPAEVPWLIAVEVPRMLMELGEMSKETHVPAMLKLCEYFTGHVDDSNYLDMYTTAISVGVVVLDHDSFLGKIQVYCAFSVGYCIYLCKHNMGHHAVEIYKTAQEKFQARFKFWLDNRHSWVSLIAAIDPIHLLLCV